MPRIRTPCVGRASRQTRTKLEKSAAEMKNSKEIKSYRSSLYFDKLSGEIRSNISLRASGNDGKLKFFDNCANRFAKICKDKGINYDEKKGVAELSDKHIKIVLMAIIKDKKDKRGRDTGEKTGVTPVHTQKSMKNAESVARRLFDDTPVADEAAGESNGKASCDQLMER